MTNKTTNGNNLGIKQSPDICRVEMLEIVSLFRELKRGSITSIRATNRNGRLVIEETRTKTITPIAKP